jgi:multidrug transporter EmrE-like cation transporter
MAWILLIGAGLLETGFAVALNASDGFSRPIPTLLFAICAIASFALLNLRVYEAGDHDLEAAEQANESSADLRSAA